MTIFLVAYDLDKPKQNYDAVHAKLEELGAERVLESTWMLKSTKSTSQIRDILTDTKGLIDTNDRVIVVKVANWHAANLMSDPNKL